MAVCVWILFILTHFTLLPCFMTYIQDESSVFVYPDGNINIPYGENLEIFCHVTGKWTSKNLNFTLGGNTVPSDIINSTTIRLFKERPRQNPRYAYSCENDKNGEEEPDYAIKIVTVATPPANVTDFECISYNLDVLNCSWSSPDKIIPTIYSLTMNIYGNTISACKPPADNQTKSCLWYSTSTSRNWYRTQLETLNFTLESQNIFGTKKQEIKLDHYSLVKPSPPVDLRNITQNAHNVLLEWKIPKQLYLVLNNNMRLEHKIEYQTVKIDKSSYFRPVNAYGLPVNKKTYTFNLTELPYAHMRYRVRVYIKLKSAKSDELWSKCSNLDVYTASEKPLKPPDMTAGGFYQNRYDNNRVMYIYWKQLEEYEEAGANFTYKVVVSHGSRNVTYWPEKDKSLGYLYLDKAPLEAMQISIWSHNEIGQSEESSHLYIPHVSETVSLRLTSFTKLAYENGTYELSWIGVPKIDNYTLFWCHHNATDICNGRINFTTLSPEKEKHVINLSRDYRYQFAISANFGTRTSGMIWAKCDISKDGIAMYGFPIRFKDHDAPGKTFVKVKWSMDCILKEGIITGYNLTYCPVVGTSTICDRAAGNITSIIINDPKQMDINVTGLQSYTTYRFSIALNTIYGLKKIESTTMSITTSEDTPTTPRNVTLSDVQSESLLMSWDPPLYLNGNISKIKYEVFNFGKSLAVFKHEDIKLSNESKIEVKLKGLHSFTNYSLSVRACNIGIVSCSNRTGDTFVRTRFGRPSKLNSPKFDGEFLRWARPEYPGGTVGWYEINIEKDDGNKTYNATDLFYHLISCDDVKKNYVKYKVRAVNIDINDNYGALASTSNVELPKRYSNDSIPLKGEWSDQISSICKDRKTDYVFRYIIIATIITLGVISIIIWYVNKVLDESDIPTPTYPPGITVFKRDTDEECSAIFDNISTLSKKTIFYGWFAGFCSGCCSFLRIEETKTDIQNNLDIFLVAKKPLMEDDRDDAATQKENHSQDNEKQNKHDKKAARSAFVYKPEASNNIDDLADQPTPQHSNHTAQNALPTSLPLTSRLDYLSPKEVKNMSSANPLKPLANKVDRKDKDQLNNFDTLVGEIVKLNKPVQKPSTCCSIRKYNANKDQVDKTANMMTKVLTEMRDVELPTNSKEDSSSKLRTIGFISNPKSKLLQQPLITSGYVSIYDTNKEIRDHKIPLNTKVSPSKLQPLSDIYRPKPKLLEQPPAKITTNGYTALEDINKHLSSNTLPPSKKIIEEIEHQAPDDAFNPKQTKSLKQPVNNGYVIVDEVKNTKFFNTNVIEKAKKNSPIALQSSDDGFSIKETKPLEHPVNNGYVTVEGVKNKEFPKANIPRMERVIEKAKKDSHIALQSPDDEFSSKETKPLEQPLNNGYVKVEEVKNRKYPKANIPTMERVIEKIKKETPIAIRYPVDGFSTKENKPLEQPVNNGYVTVEEAKNKEFPKANFPTMERVIEKAKKEIPIAIRYPDDEFSTKETKPLKQPENNGYITVEEVKNKEFPKANIPTMERVIEKTMKESPIAIRCPDDGFSTKDTKLSEQLMNNGYVIVDEFKNNAFSNSQSKEKIKIEPCRSDALFSSIKPQKLPTNSGYVSVEDMDKLTDNRIAKKELEKSIEVLPLPLNDFASQKNQRKEAVFKPQSSDDQTNHKPTKSTTTGDYIRPDEAKQKHLANIQFVGTAS